MKSDKGIFKGVELLTLSACDTFGTSDKRLSPGDEVDGFAFFAQSQGAQSVIATLWPVADKSTSFLMEEFYKQRQAKQGTFKSDALRRAQTALLMGRLPPSEEGDRRGDTVHPEAPYAHPYFWAPFILMGNWR